ncbi:glycosyltransferase [Aeromonas hydrophila]|uniref:glycosyltransferase n=2 Tax=Aeromonas hydrophila TaxID=644 RepID=UPI00256EAB99|nr:glycosyltransferase [Aeromonas hydrophila]MDL5385547.1 glycosyltransferase [Aeromonas hydrophila]
MESIIVFGSGGLFKSFHKYIYSIYDVKFLLDNDASKHGLYFNHTLIKKPDISLSTSYERIIVASFFFDEIKAQLTELGVCEKRIVNIADESQLLTIAFSEIKNNTNTRRVKNEIQAIAPSIKRDILFIVNSMVMGGSELSLINTLKTIDYSKNRVILIAINGGGILTSRIPDKVIIIEMYKTPNECAMLQCLFRHVPSEVLCKTYIGRHFDVVVAYTMGSSAKLACEISANRKIAWIHSDLSVSHPTKNNFISITDETNCYNNFTEIVLVSNSVLNGFNQLFDNVNVKKIVMGNIFDVDEVLTKATLMNVGDNVSSFDIRDGVKFIFVGRLSEEKGIIRLLNAFERSLKINSNAQLIIVGQGNLFITLKSIISDKKLDRNVFVIGECDNPYPYMRTADVLILPSYYEGQPLVIGEAFILGLPVIATGSDACREMLHDGDFGLVVENSEDGIFDGICQAILQENFISVFTKKSRCGLASLRTNMEDDFFLH